MRGKFLANILLTIIWVFLTGSFAVVNFIFGFIISFLILWIISSRDEENKYVRLIPKLISFILFFLWEVVKANIQVAYEVITPTNNMKPGIVKIPLDAKTNIEITLLANLITLTPGTLSLDVSEDKKVLYVHSMYVNDKQEFIDDIKNGFERRLLSILR
ncbi:Na+/H+ antiporter subunit E [Psychroflexus planctonicus]|uniref:Cation:proton antiporter n=1 Tax=Psychroflexus planctonicus TaxID=1526575 RepID=A0ABQ1SGJ1_9FLAO|nr:Na+/H+ antiporter subunit E [Psychroflexus planctonicus]GGE38531.1 cation:proton antiporter [Psychroflexus planctonicus]